MSQNPIWIGYRWEQALTVPADMLPGNATMRMELRPVGRASAAPVVPQLRKDSSTSWAIVLTALQTGALSAGAIVGDLVAVETGVERPLGVRLTIPVLVPMTAPTP